MHWLALVLLISLAQSARIQWTGQGGTNLWDNGRNWDCNCLPTPNDDVLIAFTLGPASIRIGAPARAKSLTIGGSQTQFFQTLTVSGSLIIGEGTLNTNGILQVETAPTSPFNVSGVFSVNGKGFTFTSGLIGGNGTIRLLSGASMNFTGPAAKEFGGGVTLSIEGDAGIYSSTGSSIFLKESSNLKVTGTLTSKTALDIVVNNKASFTTSGNGQLKFDPTSTSAKLILQGAIVLDKWTATQGAIMVLGKLTSGALTLGQNAQLQLVGGPDEQRTFVSVSGGTVLQQGGASEFQTVGGSTHSLASLTVTGGALAVSGNLNVDRLTVNGGIITGPNLINVKSAFVSFALFQNQGGLSVINSVELTGQVTVDNSRIVALQSSQVRVAGDSQLIFIGPQSSVTFRGQVFQSAPLKLVRATFTGAPPTFLVENTASWTTGSFLNSLGVPISGLGAFTLDTTGRFDFSNADFSASTFASKGSFTFQQGNFSFQSVTGSGLFVGAPQRFNATTFTASNFSLIDGSANLTKSNVNYLLVNNGQLSVTDATLGTLDWKGGLFSGTGANPQATVSSLQVSGIPAKTLQSCVMTVTGLSLTCGPTQCAFFTKDATLKTK